MSLLSFSWKRDRDTHTVLLQKQITINNTKIKKTRIKDKKGGWDE
ncbi:MAG: hypothetical protein ACI8RD_013474 [Bacillariaceae sp.]|jgi:hypothetical protein